MPRERDDRLHPWTPWRHPAPRTVCRRETPARRRDDQPAKRMLRHGLTLSAPVPVTASEHHSRAKLDIRGASSATWQSDEWRAGIGDREHAGRFASLTPRDQSRSSRSRAFPPLCTAVCLVQITDWPVQIWSFWPGAVAGSLADAVQRPWPADKACCVRYRGRLVTESKA